MFLFASVFDNTDRLWAAQSLESEEPGCGKNDFALVDTEIVKGQLYQLDDHKPVGPGGICSKALSSMSTSPWGLMGFIPKD